MTVGRRTYSGKGAREEAASALNEAILSWSHDQSPQVRAKFKGFDIVSRGHALGSDNSPDLYVRGALTYQAQLNPMSPLGTMQSIEHTLRSLDRKAEQEREDIARHEKAFSEYHGQLGRPFEHEQRLRDLLVKQAELNASLDLDKSDRQVATDDLEEKQSKAPDTFVARLADQRASEMAL
jgi:hypothetical protein